MLYLICNLGGTTAYELCNSPLRFYYTFIYESKSALTVLGAAAFYDAFFTFSLTSIVPLHFSANYFGPVFKKRGRAFSAQLQKSRLRNTSYAKSAPARA